MASMVGYQEVETLVRKVKGHGMLNKVLQQICAAENLSQRGVKAELQSRIIESRSFSSFYLAILVEASAIIPTTLLYHID